MTKKVILKQDFTLVIGVKKVAFKKGTELPLDEKTANDLVAKKIAKFVQSDSKTDKVKSESDRTKKVVERKPYTKKGVEK